VIFDRLRRSVDRFSCSVHGRCFLVHVSSNTFFAQAAFPFRLRLLLCSSCNIFNSRGMMPCNMCKTGGTAYHRTVASLHNSRYADLFDRCNDTAVDSDLGCRRKEWESIYRATQAVATFPPIEPPNGMPDAPPTRSRRKRDENEDEDNERFVFLRMIPSM
jgi:hypothetical protein